jgi:hypothetical protein
LLCEVSDQITSPGAVVGGIAASATTGAIIAMGHRAGAVGLPFASIGAVVLRGTVTSGSAGMVLVGLGIHLATIAAWSYLFLWALERFIHRDVFAALLVGAVQFALSGLVTRVTGDGLASVLPLGDRIMFALILAASLVGGIRLAFPATGPS